MDQTFNQPLDKPLRYRYGTDAEQYGDLRLPSGSGPWPVLVIIHGGFWRARYGLDLMDAMAVDFTARGIATWNIEYRRAGQPGGGFPGTLADVAAAFDFVRTLREQHPLADDAPVVIGHSAGGHLALWLAARKQLHASGCTFAGANPLPVGGVVSLAGVTDVYRMWEVRQADSPVVNFLGGKPSEVPERYAMASPRHLLPLGIRQILIHGTEDDNVPYELSVAHHAAAVAAGDAATLVTLPGIEHFKVIDPTSEVWPTVVDAVWSLF